MSPLTRIIYAAYLFLEKGTIVLSRKYYRFGENGGTFYIKNGGRIFSDCILFLSNFILIVWKEGGCNGVEGL